MSSTTDRRAWLVVPIASLATTLLISGCGSEPTSAPHSPASSDRASSSTPATASTLPASSPLKPTTVGQLSVAAPGSAPKHETASAGESWSWTGNVKKTGLLALAVARRHTNFPPTQDSVDGLLLTQVNSVKGHYDGSPDTSERDVDVPGAKAAAATTIDGTLSGVPMRHLLVMCTGGHQTMYLIQVQVMRTEAGKKLLDQVISSLALDQ